MRSHSRDQNDERQTPLERGARRRVDAEDRRPIDFARLRAPLGQSDGGERAPQPAKASAGAQVLRTVERTRSDDEGDGDNAQLARLRAEASTLKREQPLKFVAVLREVERLRAVVILEDPRRLRIEIKRHAVLLADEPDRGTAARLYTRTLALTELLQERSEDLRAARSLVEPSTTQPFPVQQAILVRPLPVLFDFDDGQLEQSNSPLARRVQKLDLSPSPLVRIVDELDTDPITGRDVTSDVFLPVGARALASLDEERSGRELPKRRVVELTERERPAAAMPAVARAVDPRASTLEMPDPPAPSRRTFEARRLRDNAREQELLRVAAKTERAYNDLAKEDPERAIRIRALVSTLHFAPELSTKERALAAHAQAWRRRAGEKDASLWRSQEDNAMALGVLARQRSDEERALARVAQEEFSQGARELPRAERDALRVELREVLSHDSSADAQYLRRELLRAVARDDVNEARIYALALDTYPHRPFTTPREDDDSQTLRPVLDAGRTQVSARDVERLDSELVDLRTAWAMRDLTAGAAARAERVVSLLSSVKDRTVPSMNAVRAVTSVSAVSPAS